MQKKIAKVVKDVAMKEAKRSVGKSLYMGMHEIRIPQELVRTDKKKED